MNSRFLSATFRRRHPLGFTLVELLVVIAIIGVLLGMSIPAMQNMRELSRRSNCQQNLIQLSLALSAYASRHGHYPAGTLAESGPIRNVPEGFHHNWISGLLPMMDAQNVYDAIDQKVSVYAPANAEVRALMLPGLICPSATQVRDNTTCYAGNHASVETPIDEANDGVMFLNRVVNDREITDGLGYTLFVGEKLSRFDEDLGWISGTRSSLRNTGHPINSDRDRLRGPQVSQAAGGTTEEGGIAPELFVGGYSSDHPGGAMLLLGSGECQFYSSSTDLRLLEQMGSRADGGIPPQMRSQQPLDEPNEDSI